MTTQPSPTVGEQKSREEWLRGLLKVAVGRFNALTPEEQRAERAAQRRNYVLAEAELGSDADERAYAAAMRANDPQLLAMLDAASKRRRAQAEAMLAEMGL